MLGEASEVIPGFQGSTGSQRPLGHLTVDGLVNVGLVNVER